MRTTPVRAPPCCHYQAYPLEYTLDYNKLYIVGPDLAKLCMPRQCLPSRLMLGGKRGAIAKSMAWGFCWRAQECRLSKYQASV